MQFAVLMQSLWCCKQILTKSVAQVHVYLPEGTLALREGTKVHIGVHFKKWHYVLLSLKMLESVIFFVPLHL